MSCWKPFLHGIWKDDISLAEFIIYYDIVGVDHFIAFDQGAWSPKAYRILNIARDLGISIEVRPWNLREFGGHELHQTLHHELCQHLAIERGYSNVITVDTDEFIVSHGQDRSVLSLKELIMQQDLKHPRAAFYRLQNVFYPLEFSDVPSASSQMKILRKYKHLEPSVIEKRTKCIIKPDRVDVVGIHRATASYSYQAVVLTANISSLHHYRQGGYDGSKVQTIYEDLTMMKHYQSTILVHKLYIALRDLLEERRSGGK